MVTPLTFGDMIEVQGKQYEVLTWQVSQDCQHTTIMIQAVDLLKAANIREMREIESKRLEVMKKLPDYMEKADKFADTCIGKEDKS